MHVMNLKISFSLNALCVRAMSRREREKLHLCQDFDLTGVGGGSG
jgi:hypothetical protein